MQRVPMARSWWLFAAGVALIGVLCLRAPSTGGAFLDLKIYADASDRMRAGENYYPAMTEAMTDLDAGPVSSVRAYRLPTVFWAWRYCCRSWLATFVLIVGIGVLVGIASAPIVGLAVVLWLAAGLHGTGLEAWAFIELWAVPFCIAVILAIRRSAWGWAALFALLGALIREQAVLLLVAGVIAAWRFRQPVWPWIASLGGWSAFFIWHVMQVQPFLVESGVEQPLFTGGGVRAVASMAGPYTYGLSVLVVAYALWRMRWTAAWWVAAPLIAGIPLIGIALERAYWGFLVLPTALALLGSVFHADEPSLVARLGREQRVPQPARVPAS